MTTGCSRAAAAHVDAERYRHARRGWCYQIQLTSNTQRVNAHKFFERNGFAPSDRGFTWSSAAG